MITRCLLLIVLWIPVAFAQDEETELLPEFKVELIVFEYVAPAAVQEDWSGPSDESVDETEVAEEEDGAQAQDVITLPETDEPELEPVVLSFRPAAREELELDEIVDKMRRSRDYRPLLHTGWIQPGYARDRAPPLPLDRLDGLPPRLGGEVSLYLSRYLHLNLDLALAAQPGTPAAQPDATGFAAFPHEAVIYSLQERRRMRSGELHFFDHPQFGVLAKITPIEPPAG